MNIWTLFNSTIILILLSKGLVILNSSKNKLSTISAYFLLSSPSYTTLPLHSFSKGVDTCELLWSCMIALTLCMFYIGMWLKEMLLHITGSAMNKGGSHHQLTYWDFARLIALLRGHCKLFYQYISEAVESCNWIKPSCFESCLPLLVL